MYCSHSAQHFIYLRIATAGDRVDERPTSLMKIAADREKEIARMKKAHQTPQYKAVSQRLIVVLICGRLCEMLVFFLLLCVHMLLCGLFSLYASACALISLNSSLIVVVSLQDKQFLLSTVSKVVPQKAAESRVPDQFWADWKKKVRDCGLECVFMLTQQVLKWLSSLRCVDPSAVRQGHRQRQGLHQHAAGAHPQ